RNPETPITRHTFNWTAMSTRIETRMAKAKAAPSWTVNSVVWVMNPGPMALVAIRKTAPSKALLLAGAGLFSAAGLLAMTLQSPGAHRQADRCESTANRR